MKSERKKKKQTLKIFLEDRAGIGKKRSFVQIYFLIICLEQYKEYNKVGSTLAYR